MNTVFDTWMIQQDMLDRYASDLLSFVPEGSVTNTHKKCEVCKELKSGFEFSSHRKGECRICKGCLPRKGNLRDGKLSYLDKKWIKLWLKEGYGKGQIARAFKVSLYMVNKIRKEWV